jgi:uncharacterized protein YgbK (DUF1537 family)
MSLIGRFAKKLSDSISPLKEQGMDYLAAAAAAGCSISTAVVTQVGASPFTVVLEDVPGLGDMENTDYLVVLQSAAGKLGTADLTSKAVGSFDITGGLDADVYEVAVIGRLKDQVA